MFESGHLHVAIASDENYARFVASLIVSIMNNNKEFDRITFHLLVNGISDESMRKIKSVLNSVSIELKIYDMSDLDGRLGIKIPQTIALTSYARLFMSRIIDEGVSRILYLDTDIVVLDNLNDMWCVDLTNNPVGGCLDVFEGTESKTSIGLPPDYPYINAGVLLINLDYWRENKLQDKFLQFLIDHNGNVHHHDQGIINGVCNYSIKLLPPQYNMHSTVFSHPFSLIKKITNPYYSRSEYEEAIKRPVIIHFTEGFYNRPWKKNCKHPYRDAFEKYNQMTPWKDEPKQADNRSMAVKILSYSFLNFPFTMYKLTVKLLANLSRCKKRQ